MGLCTSPHAHLPPPAHRRLQSEIHLSYGAHMRECISPCGAHTGMRIAIAAPVLPHPALRRSPVAPLGGPTATHSDMHIPATAPPQPPPRARSFARPLEYAFPHRRRHRHPPSARARIQDMLFVRGRAAACGNGFAYRAAGPVHADLHSLIAGSTDMRSSIVGCARNSRHVEQVAAAEPRRHARLHSDMHMSHEARIRECISTRTAAFGYA